MNRSGLSFTSAIMAGLVLSVFGAAAFHGLVLFVGVSMAAILCLSVLSFCYVAYLCFSAANKTGCLSTSGLLFLVPIVGIAFSLSLTAFFALNLLVVWLFRACKSYRSPLSALADLCLVGFGLILAAMTFQQTSSLFLTLWVFFLVQAVAVFVPENISSPNRNSADQNVTCFESSQRVTPFPNKDEHDFERSAKDAQNALNQMTKHG